MNPSNLNLVHPVPAAEFDAWCRPLVTAFLGAPESDGAKRVMESKRQWEPEQRWGVRHREDWVATLACARHSLAVPGGADVVAEGLTNVSVSGAFRRRGLLTTMMRDWMQTARDGGAPLLFLYAAEWPIYGRFGFAPASYTADYEIDATGLEVSGPGVGHIRQISADEYVTAAAPVHEAARGRSHGELRRGPEWWDAEYGLGGLPSPRVEGAPPVFFVHEGDNGIDGFVSWSTVRRSLDHGEKGVIKVEDLHATSMGAYLNLMRSVLRVDLAPHVQLPRRPVDELVRWHLSNGRALRNVYTGDAVWLRIIDVPEVLAARTYATPGRVVLDIRDDTYEGFARGLFTLDASPDGVTCVSTPDADPDLSLDQRALAAVYLGGTTFYQMSAAGLVDELRPGSLPVADSMFRTVQLPWTSTVF